MFLFVASMAAAVIAAQGTQAPASDDSQKKVCKRVETTGTILPKRDCRTKAEWAAIAEANAKNAERYARSRDTTSGRGPNMKGY